MANEKRLIDANALIRNYEAHRNLYIDAWGSFSQMPTIDKVSVDTIDTCISDVFNAPTVDAVSRGVHDQVRWERDIAMEQLEEHGISFGCTAPDVVKVVRCKDCIYYETVGKDSGKPCGYGSCGCTCQIITGIIYDDDFCSYGERKDNV